MVISDFINLWSYSTVSLHLANRRVVINQFIEFMKRALEPGSETGRVPETHVSLDISRTLSDPGSSDGVPGCYQKEYSLVRLARKNYESKKLQAASSKLQA